MKLKDMKLYVHKNKKNLLTNKKKTDNINTLKESRFASPSTIA